MRHDGGWSRSGTLILAALAVLVAPMCSSGSSGDDRSQSPIRVDGPGRLVSTVDLEAVAFALAGRSGTVWVAGDPRTTTGIDEATDAIVASVEIGESPRGIAATDEGLWVTNFGDMQAGVTTGAEIDTVSRVDPSTNTVVASIEVGSQPVGIAAAAGQVWVVNNGDDTVSRIDATTNEVTATVEVGDAPWDLAVGAGAVWVANERDHSVSRIDATTNEVTATIDVGALPGAIAAASDGVWVAIDRSSSFDAEDRLLRIDPRTAEVIDEIPTSDPHDVVVTPSGLWVSNFNDGTLTRIDPATGDVLDTVDVGPNPTALTVAEASIWALIDFGASVAHVDPGTA